MMEHDVFHGNPAENRLVAEIMYRRLDDRGLWGYGYVRAAG
jgi:hypothetical protein